MRTRTFLVGILALACGVFASLGVNSLRNAPATDQEKPDVIIVPVAAIDIKRGEKVTEEMLVGRRWPKAVTPQGAILKKAEIVGKIAQMPIAKDEPIFSGKVGDSPRFSGLIRDGMRAYTILTPTDSSLVAGLVEPGDKVDILFTDKTDRDLTGGASTVPLMQNLEVLATGRIVDPEQSREAGRRMRSVTLLVPLEMATMLALAQEMGTLHLALRSETDQSTADVSAVTLRELLRTAYPALFADEEVSEPEPVPDILTAAAELFVPQEKKKQAEIAVRTLRGVATGTLVMRATAKQAASPFRQRNFYEGGVPIPSLGDEGSTP